MNRSAIINSKTEFYFKDFSKFWVALFPMTSYLFYMYVGFDMAFVKGIYFVSLLFTITYSFSEIKLINKNLRYAGMVRNIFIMTFVSMISAYFFWGQNILLSYRMTAYSMAIVYFFFLLKVEPDIEYLEKVIWFLCITYLLIWAYALFKAPTMTFGIDTEGSIENSRGIFRLHIPGRGFIILAFFLSLNKFTNTKKNKWLVFAGIIFLVITLHVIRQVIFFSFIFGFYYLVKNRRFTWLWIIIISITMIVGSNYLIKSSRIFRSLIELSEGQLFDQQKGKDDIRVIEYEYFFTEFSKNIFTDIIGNGFSHPYSSYGKYETWLSINKNIYSSDVGYADVFIRFGLVGLVLFFLLFYKVIRQKVLSEFYYAKLFMLYMIFANIAASWVFHDIIIICISLYILEKTTPKKNFYSI